MAISNITRRIAFIFTTVVSTLPPGGFVLAQTVPGTSSESDIGEIVITAQKRTEKLSDVTVSAAVVGASTLENSNVSSISDLNRLVPSVSLSGTTNSRAPMGIRGISSISNQAAVGIVSGVAVLIDGIPVSSDSFAMKHLDDLQRIEVLKGPQSTLGGRSAAQGVINIVTRQPSDTWTGSAGSTVTNDHEERLNGFIAGPIVPGKLDFSLAVYGNKTQFPIENEFYGTHTREHTYGAHAKLLFQPNDHLNISLAGGLAHDNSYGFNLTYAYVTPGATILNSGTLGVPQLLPGITPSFANQLQNSPVPNAGSSAIDKDVSLNIDYEIGRYTLSSTTSIQRDRQDVVNDLFTVSQYFFDVLTHGAGHFDDTQRLDKAINQTSEELKLVSPADAAFSYIAGLYYAKTTADESTYRAFPGNPVVYSVNSGTTTYDLYTRTTWQFWRDLSLVTGLRYNYDDINYNMNQVANGANGLHQSAGSNISGTAVGDISLKKQLAETMLYATHALGYSPKAYNTATTLTTNLPIDPVRKTKIYHNEIGLKGAYFDHRVSLNAAVFNTVYRDFQVQTFDVPPGSTVSSPKLDSGDARTRGVEVDTVVKPTANLQLTLNMAYIDARFTNYPDAPCYAYPRGKTAPGCFIQAKTGQSIQDVSGQVMPNSPRFKAILGAEQRIPLDSIPYDVMLNGSYSYQTSAQMLPDENPQAIVPAFGLLNLSSTLAGKTGAYSVTLFCNNVFDHHYPSFVSDFWNNVWAANVVVSQPARDSVRYFGLRLNARF